MSMGLSKSSRQESCLPHQLTTRANGDGPLLTDLSGAPLHSTHLSNGFNSLSSLESIVRQGELVDGGSMGL
jgi:hypothetical protein